MIPIERTHEYRGRYHVLGGALSPIDGVEPEDLKIAQLYARGRRNGVARGHPRHQPDDDRRGDRAARRRRAAPARAGRRGHPARLRPPVGGDLEYADEVTLGRAFTGRRAL